MRWMALAFVACTHATSPAPVGTRQPGPAPAREQPQPAKKVVTETHVDILDPIKFFAGSPAIDPSSTPILDAVANTLTGNPSIKLVMVIAYGSDAVPSLQESVAIARAQAVVGELIARGVDARRLEASGEATPRSGSGLGPGPTFLIMKRDTSP